MTSLAQEGLLSVEAFLRFDDGTDQRHELVDGRIVAMAPPSPAHSRIQGNLSLTIGRQLQPPCGVVGEYGIPLTHDDRSYYQADLAVVCEVIYPDRPPPEPILVVEIVSPSSFDHDRGRKTRGYMEIPACMAILIVHSERRHIECWTREPDSWRIQDFIVEKAVIELKSPALRLELAEVYRMLEL